MADTQYLPPVYWVKYRYDDGWSRGIEEAYIYAYDKKDVKRHVILNNPNTKIHFIKVEKYD